MKKPRAALCLRVSTEEQTIGNQRPDVERIARFHKLRIVKEYSEHASVGKHRAQYEAMMTAARNHEFDVLLLWAIDRLGRSMIGNLNAMLELDRLGIRILSHREPWLDTGGPVRPLLIAIFSWVAEQERNQISERTKAGMAIARAKGHQIGNLFYAFTPAQRARVKTMMAHGRTVRYIKKKLKAPQTCVWRLMKRIEAGERKAKRLFPGEAA